MKVTVVFKPSEKGGFTVYVPGVPTFISEGKTKEEALKNIQEVLSFLLQVEDKKLLRDNTGVLVEKIEM